MAKRKSAKGARRGRRRPATERAQNRRAGFGPSYINAKDRPIFKFENQDLMKLSVLSYDVKQTGNPNAEPEDEYFERTFYIHRGLGANNKQVICLRKTFDEKCPVCEYLDELREDPDTEEKLIKSLVPKERQIFNVVDERNLDAGVQVLESSYYLFGKALDKAITDQNNLFEENPKEPCPDYFYAWDEDEGLSIYASAEEKTMGKNGKPFLSVESLTFRSRKEAFDEDLLAEQIVDLDAALIRLTYDEIKAILFQEDEDEDDEKKPEKEKEERPKRRSKRTKKKEPEEKEPEEKPEPAEDEDAEKDPPFEEEEKDDEPEEKPKRRRRRRKPEPEPEEAEEPESDVPQCPVKKGVFGESCDKFDECDECDLWDACDSAANADNDE